MSEHLIKILAATARLEEQGVGLRRDVQELKQHTTTIMAGQAIQINGLERSRALAKGWVKGVSAVTVLAAIATFFGWDG